MDIATFVRETLVEIATAVQDANTDMRERLNEKDTVAFFLMA